MLDPSRLSCLTWSARKRPDLLIAEIEISIDDAGVRMRSPMASSEQSWQVFRRCRDLGDYLMFDFGTNAGMPIPKAAFTPADCLGSRPSRRLPASSSGRKAGETGQPALRSEWRSQSCSSSSWSSPRGCSPPEGEARSPGNQSANGGAVGFEHGRVAAPTRVGLCAPAGSRRAGRSGRS